MKACQKDASFADGHCMPRILNMPQPIGEVCGWDGEADPKASLCPMLINYIQGEDTEVLKELIEAILLMDDALSLGSIMKFNISERTRNIINVRTFEYEQQGILPETCARLLPYMWMILALKIGRAHV